MIYDPTRAEIMYSGFTIQSKSITVSTNTAISNLLGTLIIIENAVTGVGYYILCTVFSHRGTAMTTGTGNVKIQNTGRGQTLDYTGNLFLSMK